MNMTHRIEDMKQEAREAMDKIRELRDELRVQIHLGGMDAKKRWEKLEEQFQQTQAAAKTASDASIQALRTALEEFKDALEASRRS
jgi:hypothetical protein